MVVTGVPCFFSDGYSCYLQALIEYYHKIKAFPRTGKRGRPKDPLKEHHPDLVYGQVVKERKKGRIVTVLFQAFYNFARPHMSLRDKINDTNTKPFEQIWIQKTPCMAAGLTDHVWSFRELLTFKFVHTP